MMGELLDIAYARQAFLDLLIGADDFHEEPDGDETGNHTRLILTAEWRLWSALADALGIPAERFDQTTFNRLERAVAEAGAPFVAWASQDGRQA